MTKQTVRTRFAPSPTGYMHIGNLRTALYGYLYAKSQQGQFILRIEDTDRTRYVADAVDFINRTLEMAHIVPDESPSLGGPYGPYVQSERMDLYKKYAEELVKTGHAYYCFCDPDEDHSAGKFGGYDRTCRNLAPEVIEEHLKNGDPYVIRQKMPLTGETTFFDVLHGNITIKNEELEDQVLLKRDGMPTYNFANVIDDHLMHITHIMRGAEFITSTPKYILLYESFGWDVPTFIHLAPVMGKNEDGSISKLSKRHGATSFDDLVKAGYLPDAIVNYVALLGWNPKTTNQEIFSMAELIEHFSLEGLSKSPAVFDYDKLGWINGEYLKAMSDEDFAKMARPFVGELPDYLEQSWTHLASLLKTRIQRLGDLPQEIAFLCEQPAFDAELYVNKRNKVTPEKAAELLPGMMALLEEVPESDWNNDALYEKLNAYIEEQGIKKGLAMWVLRIAAAGQKVTPGGATEILSLLGKKISMERIKKSLAKLQEL
ncbi:glutamate--tRNA ligase [Mitsuokella multacida]|uniref:glutamate--tRNA ligase n=1 Tax=Mitsuokella multacida TaxID=52226 RepID=UPI0024302E26|nr:glutamate--tRNA ligase [Mitsuokella multacida]MDO5582920.1 glutamate--tRNA ligase [Mitsuokella multacida]